MNPGYWPANYWPIYFPEDYWPDFGAPIPPPVFHAAAQLESIDGPGGNSLSKKYKAPVAVEDFPMSGGRRDMQGMKPKRMGFKARKTRGPFGPLS